MIEHPADAEAEALARRAGAALRQDGADVSMPPARQAQLHREIAAGLPKPARSRWTPVWIGVAAALVLGVFIGKQWRAPVTEPVSTEILAVDGNALRPVQFVFVAPAATRVALVGEFNGWNPSATPMHRAPDGTVWTATLSLPAGRHQYAFVVDDSAWTPDPQAPIAPEGWYGAKNSILLVADRSLR